MYFLAKFSLKIPNFPNSTSTNNQFFGFIILISEIPNFIEGGSYFSNSREFMKKSAMKKAVFQQKLKQNPTYNAYERDIAIVNYYFGKSTAWEFQHAPSKTMANYIAELGGFLGLFTGFSFLSAVEIIYWIIIPFMKKFAVSVKGV